MGTSKPNKIKYGLSNVFYAKLLNEVTNIYSTPVKIEGAVNLSLSQTGDTTAIYADNVEYFSLNRNG
ncbi:MAG: phage tail protein, partial [Enterococcus sp.]|nr:phage tail protein [Enterococcus sp.]